MATLSPIIIIVLISIAASLFYLLTFRVEWRGLFSTFFLPLAKITPSFITPNQITFLSFIIMLAAGVFIYLAGSAPFLLFWAAVFIALSAVTDAFDGFLARARNASSKRGMFLDYTLDKLGYLSLLFAAMLGGLIKTELVVATMVLSLFYNIIDLESLLLSKPGPHLTEHSRWVIPAIILCLTGLGTKSFGLEALPVLGIEFKVLDTVFMVLPAYVLSLGLYRSFCLWKDLKGC